MARPKSPCGTYPAYQPHLREKTPVDPACRRAQQEHDGKRSSAWRRRDVERPREAPAPVPLPVSRIDELRRQDTEHRNRFAGWAAELSEALADNDVYTVIDRITDLDKALDEWIDIRDEIDYREDWPRLEGEPELRANLMAWGREYFDGEAPEDS